MTAIYAEPSPRAMQLAVRVECEADHLFFARYFFYQREGIKFRVSWHHHLLADTVEDVLEGRVKNVIINVPPGSSKTELVSLNFMARGLVKNVRSRFLHISYADDLVALNSSTTKGIVQSDEFQALWPMAPKDDSDAKKRWNVEQAGKSAGGVYAVSLGGTITGFRAGHMAPGFQGAIIIDDPMKPVDALSETKTKASNNTLVNTIKSRKANPDTPIVVIMQRLAEEDSTGFLLAGGAGIPGRDWKHIVVPALIDDAYVATLPKKYQDLIHGDKDAAFAEAKATGLPRRKYIGEERDDKGRYSYWPYKEPLADLLGLEAASEYVFNGQYMQRPVPLGGGIFQGAWFTRYTKLPNMKYRVIYADTASKTAERNDWSVFQCVGLGVDGKIYLIDQIRGKWEAWELEFIAKAFWDLHTGIDYADLNALRKMKVEDKSSGTGLIQNIKKKGSVPIEGIERQKDKLTRAMDVQSFYKSGLVAIPDDLQTPMLTRYFNTDTRQWTNIKPALLGPWVPGYITEHESFTPDDTHKWDDQIDPTLDAVTDMLQKKSSLYENL